MPATVQSGGVVKVNKAGGISVLMELLDKQTVSVPCTCTQVQGTAGAHQRAPVSVRIRFKDKWHKTQIAIV